MNRWTLKIEKLLSSSPSQKFATGRIRFRGARFQPPNSVSFSGLTEFRGSELSEFLSAYYLVCQSELAEFSFRRTHRVTAGLSEFSLPKQYSRNSIPPVPEKSALNQARKRQININFFVRLVLGRPRVCPRDFTGFVPGTNPGFLFFLHSGSPANPGLSLGQTEFVPGTIPGTKGGTGSLCEESLCAFLARYLKCLRGPNDQKKFDRARNVQSRSKFLISLENFNLDVSNSPQKIAPRWVARSKISFSWRTFRIFFVFFRLGEGEGGVRGRREGGWLNFY